MTSRGRGNFERSREWFWRDIKYSGWLFFRGDSGCCFGVNESMFQKGFGTGYNLWKKLSSPLGNFVQFCTKLYRLDRTPLGKGRWGHYWHCGRTQESSLSAQHRFVNSLNISKVRFPSSLIILWLPCFLVVGLMFDCLCEALILPMWILIYLFICFCFGFYWSMFMCFNVLVVYFFYHVKSIQLTSLLVILLITCL